MPSEYRTDSAGIGRSAETCSVPDAGWRRRRSPCAELRRIAEVQIPAVATQVHALQSLDKIVDTFWTEISESVSKMCAV